VSYDTVNPCRLVESLPPVMRRSISNGPTSASDVAEQIDRMIQVQDALRMADYHSLPVAAVEQQQLRVELDIIEKQIEVYKIIDK
jgi:hypothetical protein